MQAQLRRYRDTLIVTGTGVIIFGVWSVIRVVILFILRDDITALTTIIGNDGGSVVLIYLVIIVILMIPLGFHLLIGLGARSEGYGRKKRYAYIVAAVILALVYAVGLVLQIVQITGGMANLANNSIITILVDMTSLFVLIQMIVSSIQVKRLGKKLAKEGTACS